MRLLHALLAVLMLASCGDGPPEGWAHPDLKLMQRVFGGCPDLNGTYRVNPPALSGNRMVLGRNGAKVQGRAFPWETITLKGDAAHSLEVTFMRGPETSRALWDWLEAHRHTPARGVLRVPREYADNEETAMAFWRGQFGWPTLSVQLRHGRDYVCAGGWLKGLIVEKKQPPAEFMIEPWQVFGNAWFGRDTAGNLLGRVDYDEPVFISLWCGDGCVGVDAGSWHGISWGRWTPAAPAWKGDIVWPWPAAQ
jgi:hypothetical protein